MQYVEGGRQEDWWEGATPKGPGEFLDRQLSLRELGAGHAGTGHPSFFFFFCLKPKRNSLVDCVRPVSQVRLAFFATLQVFCNAACPLGLAGLRLTKS